MFLSCGFTEQVLGAQKKTLSGFSSATVLPHTGLVYYSEVVQSVPSVSDTSFRTIVTHIVCACYVSVIRMYRALQYTDFFLVIPQYHFRITS